jgi:hypothetical protein
VVPPFALNPRDVSSEIEIRGELTLGGRFLRAARDLTRAAELLDRPGPAVGAREQERH